jgi:hypothetical protein
MPKNNKKQNALGTIASIQTILERYPVLITNDTMGNTSLSFTFDLLEMLGVTPDEILEWLSNLLSGSNGWLDALEYSIKGIIIQSFKDLYTCSINPRLPLSSMRSVYNNNVGYPQGKGIKINLDDIDTFGILNFCPTSEKGNVFYFDASPDCGYTPTNVFSSTDFNAYLWYVVNKGQNPPSHNSVWDNRIDYRKKFELRGDYSSISKKGKFINQFCERTALKKVPDVGTKKEILSCCFNEQGVGKHSNYLTVYINPDRYFWLVGGHAQTKTVFEFNFDYIMSLKLFDSKTLVAQIVNAVEGISKSFSINASFTKGIIAEKVREIVRKVIESEDSDSGVEDCYFTFSNDEYNRLINETTLKHGGNYEESDEQNDILIEKVKKIESSSESDRKDAVKDVIQTVTSYDYNDDEGTVSFGNGVIKKFLEETVLQVTLQILSPKVMMLYAINEKVLDPESETVGVVEFFKNFHNLLVALTKQIFNLIMEYLLEYLMGELRQILYLFTEKILLEKIAYYMLLIEQLLSNCTMGIGNLSLSFTGRRNNPLSIENVQGADIIPSKDTPVIKEC